MNKKPKEVIDVDFLDEDDSRIGIASDIRSGTTASQADQMKPKIQQSGGLSTAKNLPGKGFKASMKKKEAQTDISLSKREHEEEDKPDPSIITEKTKASPGMPRSKKSFKVNVVAPLPVPDISGMQTDRPHMNSTDRNLVDRTFASPTDNHLNFERRDARVITKLKNLTHNFQRELGVGPNRPILAGTTKDLFLRQESVGSGTTNDTMSQAFTRARNIVDNDDAAEKTKSPVSRLQKIYLDFNNNKIVSQIMGIIIMISIFGDDVRRISLPPAYDKYVDGFMTFLMSLFVIEMIANAWILKGKYLLTFDVWFDLFSTLSMLMDVTYFSEDVLATWQRNASSSSAAASQFGTRISKLLKMVRLVRLLRLSKALSKSEAAISEVQIDEVAEAMKFAESQILKMKKKKKTPVSPTALNSISDKKDEGSSSIRKGTQNYSVDGSRHNTEKDIDIELNLNLAGCNRV